MAKLFKTISLEERYNSSIHNELPAKVKAVNQGSILLQPAKPSKELESALLKTLPNAVEQNNAILKGMIKGPASIPPFVNTKFRSAISLADRLSQPKIGSTSHLGEYFLSDVHTKYIKITPFGIFNHTSTTIIQPVKTNIAQGGQNPIIFNPILSQGLIYANGVASSFINVLVPTYDSLLLQGTFFGNGVYQSFTNTILPLGVNQGPGTNPILAITVPFLAPLQGPGTNPVLAITNAAILTIQGTITTNNIVKSVITVVRSRLSGTIPQKGNVVLGVPKSIPLLEDYTTEWFDSFKGRLVSQVGLGTPKKELELYSSVVIGIPKSVVQLEDYSTRWFDSITGQMVSQTDLGTPKGGLEFVQTRQVLALSKEEQSPELNQITFEPKYTFPVLKALRYAADRALAAFSPTVKHGSSGIPTSVTKEGSTYFQDNIKTPLSIGGSNPGYKSEVETYISKLKEPVFDPSSNKAIGVDYTRLGEAGKDPVTRPFNEIVEDGDFIPLANANKLVNDTDEGATQQSTYIKRENVKDLPLSSNYATLTYDQIIEKAGSTTPRRDFRLDVSLGKLDTNQKIVRYIDNVDPEAYITKNGSVEQRSPLNAVVNDDRKSDFITLKIGSLGSSNPVVFRSYITNFNDSWTNNWEDTKLLNRLETIHSYRGTVRAGSIAFKVPALSSTDMDIIYGKLQSLVRVTSIPTAPRTEGTMMKAPICSFTLGKWYINTPIAVNSVKYDLQMAEYAWDIDKQLPQIVDVSMDFKFIIGINDGNAIPTAGLIPFA
jgi:hypothetical protein